MKVAYLGLGAWGYCLASLLSTKGYSVWCWSREEPLIKELQKTRKHPLFPGYPASENLHFTPSLAEALQGADVVIESVTSGGIRPVFTFAKELIPAKVPIVITSKGIEQKTGLTLSEVVIEVLGEEVRDRVGSLSGPSFANDVIRSLPTSVVGSAYNKHVMMGICELFATDKFRVYPNSDMLGVAYGGALKNVIAIGCGIAAGLELGESCQAALMTRGLHEIRKLGVQRGCRPETFYGLTGMGDLTLTCSSMKSRNFRFGHLLAKGYTPEEAKSEIGMVVEGAYTAVSALELSKAVATPMPITEGIYEVIYNGLNLDSSVVDLLMSRAIKEEHL
jgi:glycerol-3-phosphate dehydrogenase (NAD(P)+)